MKMMGIHMGFADRFSARMVFGLLIEEFFLEPSTPTREDMTKFKLPFFFYQIHGVRSLKYPIFNENTGRISK